LWWAISSTVGTAALVFAFKVRDRLTALEVKTGTILHFMRMEGRLDLERGGFIERNSPIDVGEIVEIVNQLGVNIREHPEFWSGMNDLLKSEPKDLADLLAWLIARYGEDCIMDRAKLYGRSILGYAEFWGVCVEKARKDGMISLIEKFGLSEREYNELADMGETP
jgi:hypothetical protein